MFIAAGSGAWSQTAAPKVAAVPTGGKTWNILTLPLVDPQIPIAVAFARTFKDALEAAAPGPVMLLAGTLTRDIAEALDVSERTVMSCRALVMEKMNADSFPDLVRKCAAFLTPLPR